MDADGSVEGDTGKGSFAAQLKQHYLVDTAG